MKCKSCDKEIVFLKTRNGKIIPINAETIKGKETYYDHKIGHISHFRDCPAANSYRNKITYRE